MLLQVLGEKFDAFREEVQILGPAKVQALRELARNMEQAAPGRCPQIRAQRSRVEATWERLDRAIKARTQVDCRRPGDEWLRGRDICAFCMHQRQPDPSGRGKGCCVCVRVCTRTCGL